MCSYCGCRNIPLIRLLTRQHEDITNHTTALREAARSNDRPAAAGAALVLAEQLNPHTHLEERGLFAEMRKDDMFTEHIDSLCAEQRSSTANWLWSQRVICPASSRCSRFWPTTSTERRTACSRPRLPSWTTNSGTTCRRPERSTPARRPGVLMRTPPARRADLPSRLSLRAGGRYDHSGLGNRCVAAAPKAEPVSRVGPMPTRFSQVRG